MIDNSDLELIGRILKPSSDILRGKTFLITGGTGFFGKWFLETFNYLNYIYNLDCELVVLSRNPKAFVDRYPRFAEKNWINYIQGDIGNFNIDQNVIIDYVIHAADDVSNLDKPGDLSKNISDSTYNIAKVANLLNPKRLIFISSGAVYAESENPIAENGPLRDEGHSFYSINKIKSEEYLKRFLLCEFVIARCFSFSGPYLDLNSRYAIGNFIRDASNGRNIAINGSGNSKRSYLYGADLAIWLITILISGKDREVYNVGSDEYVDMKALAEIISRKSNVKVNLLLKDVKENNYLPDITKSKNLGLKVYTNLNDSTEKMLNFSKDYE